MMYPEKLEVFQGKMTPLLPPAALSSDVHEPTSVTYLCPANLAPNWYIIWRGKVEGTLGNKKDGHINFKQLWCKAGENLGIEYIYSPSSVRLSTIEKAQKLLRYVPCQEVSTLFCQWDWDK